MQEKYEDGHLYQKIGGNWVHRHDICSGEHSVFDDPKDASGPPHFHDDREVCRDFRCYDQRFVIGNDGADDSRRDERRYLEGVSDEKLRRRKE